MLNVKVVEVANGFIVFPSRTRIEWEDNIQKIDQVHVFPDLDSMTEWLSRNVSFARVAKVPHE